QHPRIASVLPLEDGPRAIDDVVHRERLVADLRHEEGLELDLRIGALAGKDGGVALLARVFHLRDREHRRAREGEDGRGCREDGYPMALDELAGAIAERGRPRADGLLLPIAAQVVRELGDRLVALAWILAQCFVDDRAEIAQRQRNGLALMQS